jgi:7-keto-8-aminopelargonate synthetase-like enzyme
LVNAALKALELHTREPALRTRLNWNAARVKSALRQRGVRFPETPGPIIQVIPADAKTAARLRRKLLAAGIYPPFVRYPGGPPGGSYRFVISSEHTRQQLDALVGVLCRVLGSPVSPS